ncbi:MAG TPA: hypothetical protein VIG33_02460 [Pseudobdellovibrionaceae bacterium]
MKRKSLMKNLMTLIPILLLAPPVMAQAPTEAWQDAQRACAIKAQALTGNIKYEIEFEFNNWIECQAKAVSQNDKDCSANFRLLQKVIESNVKAAEEYLKDCEVPCSQ